jgi:small conductance mechanosensitive channel
MIENPVQYLLNSLAEVGPSIAVVLVGFWLARAVQRRLSSWMARLSFVEDREAQLVGKVVFWILLLLAALIALALLGFNLQSIVTFLSLLVVVLVIAFQQSLSNFAATVIFYVFRLERPGDYIETMGQEGIVQEIHLFHTTLVRPDGKSVSLPHARMLDSGLVNRTRLEKFRVEALFDVTYGNDVERIQKAVLSVLEQDARVQPLPPPEVAVIDITVIAVRLAARATVPWQEAPRFQTDVRQHIAEIVIAERERSAPPPAPVPPPGSA